MVNKETGESFIFDVYDGDREKNQVRYEQIGKVIISISSLLMKMCSFKVN